MAERINEVWNLVLPTFHCVNHSSYSEAARSNLSGCSHNNVLYKYPRAELRTELWLSKRRSWPSFFVYHLMVSVAPRESS